MLKSQVFIVILLLISFPQPGINEFFLPQAVEGAHQQNNSGKIIALALQILYNEFVKWG